LAEGVKKKVPDTFFCSIVPFLRCPRKWGQLIPTPFLASMPRQDYSRKAERLFIRAVENMAVFLAMGQGYYFSFNMRWFLATFHLLNSVISTGHSH
jgi:hypothetical protein